jgi:hypothetical protein
MKLLKASLLLAAASTTQLIATDFQATWSGVGGTATATIVVDDLLFNASGSNNMDSSSSWLTSFNMTVTNGTTPVFFTKSDLDHGWLSLNGLQITSANIINSSTRTVDLHFEVISGGNTAHQTSFNFGTNSVNGSLDSSSVYGLMDLVSFSLAGPSGVSDFVDWMSSVNNQNRVYTAGTTLANLPLEGAHHRPMMSFDRMGKDTQYWATGDFGSSSRVRDVKVTSGEVGVNKDIGPNTLAGFAIGRGQQNQDLALDGSNNVVGNYFLGEIDYRPFGSQWIVSLLGMVGSWDAKINRGYDNGGSTDYSLGQTDIITRSARLRVDAPVLFSVAGFGFSPYASYAVTQTTVDAYTENGGGLPASYDEQQHNATEARLGMMATNVINAKTKLIISLEGIHRFDGAGPALTGQDITGSVGFSLPGQAPRPDCVRLGVDVDYKLAADTLLNVSAHASTVGEVADVSGAISIRRAF